MENDPGMRHLRALIITSLHQKRVYCCRPRSTY